jgi:hypothetical protein
MRKALVFLTLVMALAFTAVASPTIIASGDPTQAAGAFQLPSTAVQWNTGLNGLGGVQKNWNIVPNGAWDGPLGPGGVALPDGSQSAHSRWVSFIDNQNATPDNKTRAAGCNDPICNGEYVEFYHQFTLTGSDFTGSRLWVLADDTTEVFVNGVSIQAASTSTSGTCANPEIGCLDTTKGSFTSTFASNLQNGVNTLKFKVNQTWGTGFGLNYYAEIVPEPGFYGVLALGLGGLYFAVQRRRKTNV